jgi:hypothetical protein
LFFACAECNAFDTPGDADKIVATKFVVAAKRSKCSAPGTDDFEGSDMSGITPKCQATFNTCIDDSASCGVRKQKCKEFNKMDKDGSCYKKQRS